jgi:hypothetical protein
VNTCTKADDAVVCLAYPRDGETVTDELAASLPHHTAGSIRMRLQNFQSLKTAGAAGLPNASAQTREVWTLVAAAGNAGKVGDSAGA